MTDSRQRSTFAHTSSSLDLTSPDIMSPARSFPVGSSAQPAWPVGQSANDSYFPHASSSRSPPAAGPRALVAGLFNQSKPMARKHSDDINNTHLNGYPPLGNGYAPSNPYGGGQYGVELPVPYRKSMNASPARRSASPHPFAIPKVTIPGIATIRFMALCTLWYASSAVSSNTGKVILNNFKFPVTLTIVQFFFVAALCVVCSRPELGWTGRLRSPTRAILKGTLPMAGFQVGGHIFSSLAMSRVPVSTVHTIKALSPLFTVLAYAVAFGVSYSPATYLSLLPLTLGVMLACSFDMTISNFFGLICAFGSTLIFVSQNIFFKKIMPTNADVSTGPAASARLDKINLLYFSSGTAFVLMVPLWLYSDAWRLLDRAMTSTNVGGPSITLYFVINGVVHFGQNLLAFAILSSTSPVTYSIASLVKRIAVICLAIVWFKQAVHPIQAMGIILTAVGLWMYNNAKRDVEKGEKKMRQVEAVREGMLPTSMADHAVLDGRGLELKAMEKEIHSSPKPVYASDFPLVPLSKSSAVRPNGFHLPPAVTQAIAIPPKHAAVPPTVDIPYPSPPDSTASSPQAGPILMKSPSAARQRRLSVDHERDGPRTSSTAASVRALPTVDEPVGGMRHHGRALDPPLPVTAGA